MIERITRSLAYMLRHQPEQFDLELDAFGYADLDEVVRALNERLGEPVEDGDVQEAVASGDRQRYEIKNDRIRALYGHSIAVEPGEPSQPPETLFVGLSSRDAERAGRYGLRGGRRRFLHLALTEADAIDAGKRIAREYAVVTVHSLDAWEDGVNFYDRKSLFLSEAIPTRFLEVGDIADDGNPPERHQRSDEPRRDDGERGSGQGGRRGGRDRERGDRPQRPDSQGERRGRGEGHSRDDRQSRGGGGGRGARTERHGERPERNGQRGSVERQGQRAPRGREQHASAGASGAQAGRASQERGPQERAPQERAPQEREPQEREPQERAQQRKPERPQERVEFGLGVFEPKPAQPQPKAPRPSAREEARPKSKARKTEEHAPRVGDGAGEEAASGGDSDKGSFGAGL